MSSTMTAFLLSFMCFASINIGVTRGAALDLIFIVDAGMSTPDGSELRDFIQNVVGGIDITNEVQVGLIGTNTPNVPVSNLTFWTDQAAFNTALFGINPDENVQVTAALQTSANLFASSFRANNCSTVRALVIIARRIDDGGASDVDFSTALSNLQSNLGVITYGVGTSSAIHSALPEISQSDSARQYALNSYSDLGISGRSADLGSKLLAIEVTGCQCEPNPCQNGGTCVPRGTTRFECQCAGDFFGKLCKFCAK